MSRKVEGGRVSVEDAKVMLKSSDCVDECAAVEKSGRVFMTDKVAFFSEWELA